MYTEWTKHLSTETDKTEWKKDVQSSKTILDHLLKLLKDRDAAQDKAELDSRVYDKPNWEFRQADLLGARRERNYLKTLIDLGQQEQT